jgi:hypothetical protein
MQIKWVALSSELTFKFGFVIQECLMDGSHKSRSLVGKYSAFAPGVRPYTKKYKPRKLSPRIYLVRKPLES